jgi:hypothetical protein
MTADAETASGYKGYKVSASSQLTNYQGYRAFDKTGWETPGSENNNAWVSDGSKYVAATGLPDTGAATTSYVGGTATGEYVQLQLPHKIKISKYDYTPRTHTGNDEGKGAPKTVKLLGSSDNGSTWTLIKDITHTGTRPEEGVFYTTQVGATEYYDYIRFVATSTYSDGTSPTFTDVRLSQIRFYGHEEGSGSLDTTLKSVYNVPATTGTQLEVYYDAKDLTTMPSIVTDLSPNTNNGIVSGDPQVSNGAFVFDGVGDSIGGSVTNGTGELNFTISMWVKPNVLDDSPFLFGENTNTKGFGMDISSGVINLFVVGETAQRYNTSDLLHVGEWSHLIFYRNNGEMSIYKNGIYIYPTRVGSGALDLNVNTQFTVGSRDTSNYFTGSIANFRLYSKALNADQVKELYDYQKDYFLGSKSQVTLYKGHLGVGVTEPSGQLELAGDERIQEYPPRAMTKNETLVEGHGVFSALGGTGGETYAPWKAFDKSTSTFWIDGEIRYSDVTPFGALSTASKTTLYDGSVLSGGWIDLECPYPVKLKRVGTAPRTNYSSIGLQRGIILGSNNGVDWYQIDTIDYAGTTPPNTLTYFDITTETYYSHLRLVCTNLTARYPASGTSDMHWQMGELVYFGTPGPTTLDKGSLTLGRSLDVPRISRYDVDTETPRPEKLVVDFDTTVNSSPTDISGKGNHGVMLSGASYSTADKAFDFNATSGTADTNGPSGSDNWGSIETTVPQLNGAQEITFSGWFKLDAIGVFQILYLLGRVTRTQDNNHMHWFAVSENGTLRAVVSGGAHINVYYTNTVLVENRWYHISYSIPSGTTVARDDVKVYLDGVEQVSTSRTGSASAIDIGDTGDAKLYLGWQEGSTNYFAGRVSNFKIYNAVLEPSEVQKLYRLGRTGRSMVISDTAVGIGKVPEAQLDVRGTANFGSRVGIGKTDPGTALDVLGTIRLQTGQTDATGGEFNIDTNVGHIRRKVDGNGVSLTSYDDFQFYVNATGGSAEGGTRAMIINNSGNVGIGTNIPTSRLEVSGINTAHNTTIYPLTVTTISSSSTAVEEGIGTGIEFRVERRDTDNIQNECGAIRVYGSEGIPGTSDYWNMAFRVKSNDTIFEPMTLKYNGSVGINDNTPSYKLDVNGTLRCFGFTDSSSDDRIKYNEQNVSNALTLISQLNPQKYEKIMERPNPCEGTWIPTDEEWDNVKDEYEYGDEFGFIAQDVRNIPELAFLVHGEETRTDTKTSTPEEYSNLTTEEQSTYTISYLHESNVVTQEEYSNLSPEEQEVSVTQYTKQIETQTPLSLNYNGLFVVAIGAIKELKAKNDALEARIMALESA